MGVKYSIQRLMLLGVVASLFLIVGTAVALYDEFNMFVDHAYEDANTLINLWEKSVARPVWDYDIEDVQGQLRSFVDLKEVIGVQVLGESGAVIALVGDMKEDVRYGFTLRRSVTYNLDGETKEIGMLVVNYSFAELYQGFYRKLAARIIGAAVILCVVLVALYAAIDLTRREMEAQKQKDVRRQKVKTLVNAFEVRAEQVLNTVNNAAVVLKDTASHMSQVSNNLGKESSHALQQSQDAVQDMNAMTVAANRLYEVVGSLQQDISGSQQVLSEASLHQTEAQATAQQLGGAVQSIGAMITAIQGIAEQIDLLALNATIEAARAGEAGKGFAVVASEVKTLSGQTGHATGDIIKQIDTIRAVAERIQDVVGKMSTSVQVCDQMFGGTNHWISEQGGAAQSLAMSTQEVLRRNQSMTTSMQALQGVADHTRFAASDVLKAADSMARECMELESALVQFLTSLQAA